MEHILRRNADPSFSGDDSAYSALSGALTYQALAGEQRLDPDISNLTGDDEYTGYLRNIWRNLVANPAYLPCGELRLKNFLLVGAAGLCVDANHGVALVGSPVNWGLDYARWYISELAKREPQIAVVDADRFTLDLHGDEPVDDRKGLLLASPGSDVYGHWIIDYVPRLFLSQYIDPAYTARMLLSHVPRWAPVFFDAFKIQPEQLDFFDAEKLVVYSDLRMPSGAKNGFSMAQPINKLAWIHFRDWVAEQGAARPALDFRTSEKIFLSRRSFGSQRPIENIQKLEEIAQARGYDIIEPEKFDIFAQAEILRRARIVVGEDGSALHNILFSRPGAQLGVVAVAERPNLWHISMCQAMGHRISYILAHSAADGLRNVDEAAFEAFLKRLET
jgi:capsular polysaccharide biosynthesis protein